MPDLEPSDPCRNVSAQYVPQNVTRQSDLPTGQYPYIALVPWITPDCTKSYLAAASGVSGMIVYLPDNRTMTPPLVNDPVWKLDDGGSWKSKNNYPVYAIPGSAGSMIMRQLSLYSSNSTGIVNASLLTADYNSNDFIRLYTSISLTSQSALPSLWEFLLIVLGVVLILIGMTSVSMHCIQRKKRQALRRRITNGEVDLEALGIKRLTVPREAIDKMSLFIYTAKENQPVGGDILKSSPKASDLFSEKLSLPTPILKSRSVSAPLQLSMASPKIPETTSLPPSPLPLRQLSYSQPTCPICLDDFEFDSSIVRELPCQHIFHPGCIDVFLTENSSLCPVCKCKVLPKGYCPEIVTNAMVRRERQARRRQQQRALAVLEERETGVDIHNEEPTVGRRIVNSYRSFGQSARMSTGSRRISSAPAAPAAPGVVRSDNGALASNSHQETAQIPLRPNANRSDWARRRLSGLLGHQQTIDDEDRERWARLPKCELITLIPFELIHIFHLRLTNAVSKLTNTWSNRAKGYQSDISGLSLT